MRPFSMDLREQIEALEARVAELEEEVRRLRGARPLQNASLLPSSQHPHGKPMKLRPGRRGLFLGCTGYPKCRTTREVPPEVMEKVEAAQAAASNCNDSTQLVPCPGFGSTMRCLPGDYLHQFTLDAARLRRIPTSSFA